MTRSAVISPDGQYRYALRRMWNDRRPTVLFIGLNPSTADHRVDDRTVRRCIRFARDWGFGQLAMGNLFAFRTSSPRRLRSVPNPIGPRNDAWLRRLIAGADEVVAAWGNGGSYLDRDRAVFAMLKRSRCLATTKRGCPRHPLYVPAIAQLRNFAM